MLCLTALFVVFVTGASAYDLWVGGVQVKSSNESDITGDNIKCNSPSVNGGKPKVYYESASNTLYLYNVKIERTGKDHHAIENKGLPGLKIVLYGANKLKATDSSPVRLDANTSITTTWSDYGLGTTTIEGGSEDAIYAGKDSDGNSPTITIYDAYLVIKSESSCFDTSCSPSLTIKDSFVTAICSKSKSGDCYALYDFKRLTVSNSTVNLQGYSQAIKNLTSLTLAAGMFIELPSGGYFSSGSKTVVTSSGNITNVVTFNTGIAIDASTFPDANFRNWVLSQSYGNDGALTKSEIKSIKEINVENLSISFLRGIEHFTALQSLHCQNNRLTTIDLSQNKTLEKVYCEGNKIRGTGADDLISHLPQTERGYLYFYRNEAKDGNMLTPEQVNEATQRGWTVLKLDESLQPSFYAGEYPITAIDETNFPDKNFRSWVSAYCDRDRDGELSSTEIEAVTDILVPEKHIASLKGIECFAAMTELYCNDNELTTLDLRKNSALTKIRCYGNQLTSLNVSGCTALRDLNCSENQLNMLDVSKNRGLTKLDCSQNSLASIDVSKNAGLLCLACSDNNISAIEVSRNTLLEELFCDNIPLSSLDISKNTALYLLSCENNSLGSLDLSVNTEIEFLYCGNNQLTTLDVSKNQKLCELRCYDNRLTTLDASSCNRLKYLQCYGNRIRGAAMTELVNSLCDRLESSPGELRVCKDETADGNTITSVQAKTAKNKNWSVLQHDGSDWVDYEGEPVGISDASHLNDKGKMRNDSWYDLQGRKIKPQTSNLKSQTSTLKSQRSKLLKGVNIVGGKKVVNK